MKNESPDDICECLHKRKEHSPFPPFECYKHLHKKKKGRDEYEHFDCYCKEFKEKKKNELGLVHDDLKKAVEELK